jgi:hypothetical protein
VDTLFLNPELRFLWGSYDPDSHTIQYDEGFTGDNHCLIDAAARQVLLSGAKVYRAGAGELPAEIPVWASSVSRGSGRGRRTHRS